MPSGPVSENDSVPKDKLVGNLTMTTYEVEGVSTLKVYENYKNALKKLEATLVFVCERDKCGQEADACPLAQAMPGKGHVGNYYQKPYFIRAQLAAGK